MARSYDESFPHPDSPEGQAWQARCLREGLPNPYAGPDEQHLITEQVAIILERSWDQHSLQSEIGVMMEEGPPQRFWIEDLGGDGGRDGQTYSEDPLITGFSIHTGDGAIGSSYSLMIVPHDKRHSLMPVRVRPLYQLHAVCGSQTATSWHEKLDDAKSAASYLHGQLARQASYAVVEDISGQWTEAAAGDGYVCASYHDGEPATYRITERRLGALPQWH